MTWCSDLFDFDIDLDACTRKMYAVTYCTNINVSIMLNLFTAVTEIHARDFLKLEDTRQKYI